jgi:hypothetical protein
MIHLVFCLFTNNDLYSIRNTYLMNWESNIHKYCDNEVTLRYKLSVSLKLADHNIYTYTHTHTHTDILRRKL